jgi:hypothetical protein
MDSVGANLVFAAVFRRLPTPQLTQKAGEYQIHPYVTTSERVVEDPYDWRKLDANHHRRLPQAEEGACPK